MIHQSSEAITDLPVSEVLWQSCDGMMVIDEKRRILAMNPALEELSGRHSEEVAGKNECSLLFSCRDLQGCSLASHPWECPGIRAMQRFESVQEAEFTIRNAWGKGIVVSASYTPIQLPGRPVWALVVFRDVTVKKREELRMIQRAKTDPLTGLPNRTAFLEIGFKELHRAGRFNRSLTVVMADLDQFKFYNDIYGHLSGDRLLKSLAAILRAGRRTADLVTRYGGDEFALLFPETDSAGAVLIAQRLCFAAGKLLLKDHNIPKPAKPLVPVTMSMGLAVFPGEGNTLEELLEQADRRLYEAKDRGGNCVVGPT